MKFSKCLFLSTLLALTLSGCNRGSRGGGGGGKKSGNIPPMELTEEQQIIYNEHYTNKVDCFGNGGRTYDLINKVGYDLIEEIHKYLIDQHKVYYKYQQINGVLYSDIDKNTSGKIELFYTGAQKSSYRSGSTSGTQNREHVWPCERSTGLWYRQSTTWEQQIDTNGNYWGGGSDLFHVRPSDAVVNTTRSNARFYQFSGSEVYEECGESGGLYNIKIDSSLSAKKVEVHDAFKGDTARLLAYMYVHYNRMGYDVYYSNNYVAPTPVYDKSQAVPTGKGSDNKNHDPNVCGLLNFTDIFAYKNESDCIAVLKQWNAVDAPSETEKMRNNSVERKQQNRNPFVDFPQLIDRCFG